MWRWVLAIVILIISIGVAAWAGEYIGLWSVSRRVLDLAVTHPALAPHVEMYRVGRGDWREWERRQREQAQWEEDLRREAVRLAEEEARLAREWRELEKEREALKREEERIAARLQELQAAQEEAETLDRLREIYEAMRPADAAAVVESLDDDMVVELLQLLDARRAARILGEMSPERAAALTGLVRQDR